MTELSEAVREIIEDMDRSGDGFTTSKAALMLYQRAERETGRRLSPLTAALARMGSSAAMRDARAARQSPLRLVQSIVSAAGSQQRDMAELSEDYGWIDQYTALEEGEAAVRKRISNLTHAEVLRVIGLKRRKAAQAVAMANRLQLIVDEHPEWADHPELLLADVIRPQGRAQAA